MKKIAFFIVLIILFVSSAYAQRFENLFFKKLSDTEGVTIAWIDSVADVMEYREGDMVRTPMKIPGLKKYSNITLKKGLADSKVMYDWVIAGVDGAVQRKTITISLMDETAAVVASWQVINAWPMKYTAPDFNATSSEVAIETLEIAHEGMTRVQ